MLITVLVGTNNAVQVGALSFHEESISKRRSREALLVKNVNIRTVNAGVVPEINRAEREWFRLLVGPNIICVANLDKAFAEQNTQVRGIKTPSGDVEIGARFGNTRDKRRSKRSAKRRRLVRLMGRVGGG